MALDLLKNGIAMTPSKRHRIGALDLVQFTGLMILIGFIYKLFGPGLRPHLSPSLIALIGIGMFFLVWPMSLKAKE